MTDPRIDEIRKRRNAITKGWWAIDSRSPIYSAPEIIAPSPNGAERIAKCILNNGSEDIGQARANAWFIVNAQHDIDYLLKVIDALTNGGAS
jgi:hypothetical protein